MRLIYMIAADVLRALHRMRDFYGESIIKFIDSARQKLAASHDADPEPF